MPERLGDVFLPLTPAGDERHAVVCGRVRCVASALGPELRCRVIQRKWPGWDGMVRRSSSGTDSPATEQTRSTGLTGTWEGQSHAFMGRSVGSWIMTAVCAASSDG
jgi:hypothetical protein